MKKLIICEKPSLAKNVCNALALTGEKAQRKDGYYETSSYIIAPAFGHLFTLCSIEEYRPDYNPAEKYSWTLDVLPFVPDTFKFQLKQDPATRKPDAGVKKQYGVLKTLINSNEIDTIINCGDADREGEIIVRLILAQAGNKKPVKRLWIPDQTEKTILNGLKTLQEGKSYDALAAEGYARMYMDWLYGINLTRYATIKYGKMLRIGRVIGAIVKAICDRDRAIKDFKPVTYIQPTSNAETNGCKIELSSKNRFAADKKADAEALCSEYNALGAVVKDKKIEKKAVPSPKLFSQSGLQNVLSKRYGFAPDKTLSLVQKLYESGYVSYPRTPTEYLATAEKDNVKAIIDAINGDAGALSFKDSKRIFDDSKIESHSAITPTTKIPKPDALTGDDKICYDTIYNRFCAVFCSAECIEEKTTITIAVGDKEDFDLKGSVPIQAGWKAHDQPDKEDEQEKVLPALSVGDKVNVLFLPQTKETTPPKHFTVETLNNYLRNPFKSEKAAETDDEDYKTLLAGLEIGTEATRSGIIKTAIDSQYIALTKSTYKILPAGETLVDTMAKLNIDMSTQKTAMMGKAVKDVFKGEKRIEDVVSVTKAELAGIIGQKVDIERFEKPAPEAYGACPRCGKPVIETPKAYSCASGKGGCGFAIWKDNAFLTGAKKKLTGSMVKSLLKSGSVQVKGLTSKAGKKYDCSIVLEDTGKYVNLKPDFNK